MKILINLTLIVLFNITLIFAQSNDDISILQKHYEAFEYSTVVSKASNLLMDIERFTDDVLTQIYTIKAASHYAMGDQQNSRKTFIELLKTDEEYELSDITYSPKLVNFFNDVKEEFLDIMNVKRNKINTDTRLNEDLKLESDFNYEKNIALAKSIVIAGWGHLHLNADTKGWILTSASAAALSSMVYFIFNTSSKENEYLSETNADLIQTKYDEYNKSFKIRNVLIATYAAIWLYSQIDLLFFSSELGSQNISISNLNNLHFQNQNSFTLSVSIPF